MIFTICGLPARARSLWETDLKKSQAMENAKVTQLPQSQFFTRLARIPVINSAIGYASELYGKAKSSGGFVGRTIGVAENVANVAAVKALPMVPPFAVQHLAKVDILAMMGLEKLEQNVPAINKKPQQLVSETKELISARVTPAVETFNHYSQTFLQSKMLKVTFDLFENVLKTMNHTLDLVLPPENGEKVDQNGYVGENGENSPLDGGARAGFLFRKTVYFFSTATRRIFGIAQSRVDSAKLVTGQAVSTVNESIQKMIPHSGERNGEAKPKKSKKVQ